METTEKTFATIGKWAYRVANFLYYFRAGKENNYPTCCVLQFSFEGAWKMRGQAIRRGIIFSGTPEAYVPCAFHKHRHPEWSPWDGQHGYHRYQLRLFDHI